MPERAAAAELLATRYARSSVGGRPILELAARMWEADRYEAFRVCYQAMRTADDLVDGARARGLPIPGDEKRAIAERVRRVLCLNDGSNAELCTVQLEFDLPARAWELWTRAMLRDLDQNGFSSFRGYRRYAEGAAVAPGAIFMHFCAVTRSGGAYTSPNFDVIRAATPLAMFCYLVHVLRDFHEDQILGLQYFPDDLLARCGLTRRTLRSIAERGAGGAAFDRLIREYQRIGGYYVQRARQSLPVVSAQVEPRYLLSLEMVLALYLKLFEKIDSDSVARGTLSLEAEEVLATIATVLERRCRMVNA